MPLTSTWFSGNLRLQSCLVSDPSHVQIGSVGMHVLLIQQALRMLEDAPIEAGEMAGLRYGSSTAAAVLAYKQKRDIINRKYQTTADSIVGKMTIASLDQEMRIKEQQLFTISGSSLPFLRGGFFAPTIKSTVKGVVVTEVNSPWFAWAKNFKKTFESVGADMVQIANGAPLPIVANALKLAAAKAGPRGFVILSVGHGGEAEAGALDTEGFFDLGPGSVFRVGGQNAFLVGDPPPDDDPKKRPNQVSAFYDVRAANSILRGGLGASREEEDKKSTSAAARKRLQNWEEYKGVSTSFKTLSGVILLTCKVAGSQGFLRRVREQWGTPIIAYKKRVVGQTQDNGRTRIFLEGDAPGTRTNTPLGEFLFPISKDLVVF